MIDVLETFYQLKEAGQISQEWFFTFVDELMAKQLSDITDEDVKSLREQIINMIISVEEDEVDKMLVKYYDESFKYSHRVLLVSHSQGNLFANRIHDKIVPTQYQNYFANLQVASPASEVKAQKGDYVTGFVDPIINPIPGSMPSNADLDFPGGHKFVEAYLASQDTLTKITDKMKQLLVSLDAEPSQWQTDQELDKGTKDYKITVKHRFDSSVVMSEEVYPFAASKKLYHVTDNTGGNGWVKASCGGIEVFDSWTDKQDNQFYLIDNPQEEKIYAEEEFICIDALSNGYHVMATYCSYSSSDIGRFWLRDGGFVNISSSSKGAYANGLASQYNHCGVYPSGTISSLGGQSACHEAHLYIGD